MFPPELTGRSWCDDLQRLVAECGPAVAAVHGLPPEFQRAHHAIVLVQPHPMGPDAGERPFAATAYARVIGQPAAVAQPKTNTRAEAAFGPLLARLHEKNFLRSAILVGRGGIAVALALAAAEGRLGCYADLGKTEAESALEAFFGESPARALLTCIPSAHLPLTNTIERSGVFAAAAIGRVTAGELALAWEGKELCRCSQAPTPNV